MNKTNKKAQVAFFLAPLVAMALSLAALFAMASFGNNLGSESAEFSELMSHLILNEKYVKSQAQLIGDISLKSCGECDSEQFKAKYKEEADIKDLKIQEAGNFFGKVRNNDFSVIIERTDKGQKYIVKFENLFVKSQTGNSELTREFNLILTFEKN